MSSKLLKVSFSVVDLKNKNIKGFKRVCKCGCLRLRRYFIGMQGNGSRFEMANEVPAQMAYAEGTHSMLDWGEFTVEDEGANTTGRGCAPNEHNVNIHLMTSCCLALF